MHILYLDLITFEGTGELCSPRSVKSVLLVMLAICSRVGWEYWIVFNLNFLLVLLIKLGLNYRKNVTLTHSVAFPQELLSHATTYDFNATKHWIQLLESIFCVDLHINHHPKQGTNVMIASLSKKKLKKKKRR